ncbi:hypothetical protein [Xylophilus sp. GOD-11R]|uniref:hypothetical protein n=1 Tax=Xylophilus sp. GOD-11R TaxID=3089814 RepID=UPI00298BF9D4|nr:hypothetical protein [Xylophilus sp. GOD-11R]WPB57842.1 hypothetical protein R9X41_04120 [Xylophilus sp. GOD-11R]
MQTESVFRHGDYQLACSARRLANGRYLPSLVVTKNVWPTRARTIAIEARDFEVETAAIEEARIRGLEWIAHYG